MESGRVVERETGMDVTGFAGRVYEGGGRSLGRRFVVGTLGRGFVVYRWERGLGGRADCCALSNEQRLAVDVAR